MRRWVYLGVVVSLAVGNTGCAWLRSLFSHFHEPSLSFDRAELRDLNLRSATVDLHWLLRNDNPIGINLASLSYAFSVEGHPLVSGHPPNGLQIAAEGTSRLDFPAHVEFSALAPTVEVFLTKDVAHYTASGSVGINTPIGVITLPLSYSGQFPVPKLPDIQPIAPVLNSLDFNGAHLTFPLQIHNKNGFPLPFNGLSGALTLSGASVASSNVGTMNSLAPNETRVVNLGVDVNFMQAGLNVANALRNRNVAVGYRGSLNIAGFNVPINISQNFNLR
jgi:LEA14-like dessication related protein